MAPWIDTRRIDTRRIDTRRIGRAIFLSLTFCAVAGVAQTGVAPNNPILPGDHPDPTIIRIDKTYWTTSTSGDWAPEFTLYRSTDLKHWSAAGSVFPHPPAWAQGSFWAPEMVAEGGRILVYYVARKHDGPLCVGVATAATPAGPYDDHGPIVCQEDGSIDPAFARDETGKPFLIWKEDGNSRSQPTRIWAQPLMADLIHPTGVKTELLVNDPESWEGGVIEAPYILRHDGSFYMFYAGNACCGTECHYAEGVARASHLLGPWTRDPANPIIAANGSWRCPGHGTAVRTPAGQDLFLYHAYPAEGTVYLGRESVMDAISWSADGWPVVNGGKGPGESKPQPFASDYTDAFHGPVLDAEWKWPVGDEPRLRVGAAGLTLFAPADRSQSFVARSLVTPTYEATVGVLPGGDAPGGLGLIGDAINDVVLLRDREGLQLWHSSRDGGDTLWRQPVPARETAWLRVVSAGNGEARFSYRVGDGQWNAAGEGIRLKQLLPWDSGLRVGLVVRGASTGSSPDEATTFTDFKLAVEQPGSAAAHRLLAEDYLRLNDPKRSLEEYTRAAAIEHPTATDLQHVAKDYVLLGDMTSAEHWLTVSLQGNDRDPETWYSLGRVRYTEQRFQEAAECFERSLALLPRSGKAENNLGLSYEGLNRMDDAVAAYRQAIVWQQDQPHPSEQPLLNLGIVLLHQGRLEEARSLLIQAVTIAPRDPRIHEQLGHVYLQMKLLAQARLQFEEAIQLEPKNPALHFLLGKVYHQQGEEALARSEFAASAALSGDHSTPDNF